jgi:D-sedoheptulose 7-phosphate isomerase
VLAKEAFESLATGHVGQLEALLRTVDRDALFRVHGRLCAAREGGHTVYLAGNGGSAATATHWANDLGKATKRSGRAPIRVLSLSDNTSWFTALANDEGVDAVFAGQLENFAREGDLLVAISASGNSPNLIRAVELARTRGVATIGMLGFDGGRLRSLVEEAVWVQSEAGAYELVEDAHLVLCHVLTRSLVADTAATPASFLEKTIFA